MNISLMTTLLPVAQSQNNISGINYGRILLNKSNQLNGLRDIFSIRQTRYIQPMLG